MKYFFLGTEAIQFYVHLYLFPALRGVCIFGYAMDSVLLKWINPWHKAWEQNHIDRDKAVDLLKFTKFLWTIGIIVTALMLIK